MMNGAARPLIVAATAAMPPSRRDWGRAISAELGDLDSRASQARLMPGFPAIAAARAGAARPLQDQTRTVAAAVLVPELVPAARQGLVEAGVAAEEADGLLEIISARAATGQTGAAWQRATLAAAGQRHDRERAVTVMLSRYLRYSGTGQPVHTWPRLLASIPWR